MSTMKKEILTEWLRRLRSGDYKQGESRLKQQPDVSFGEKQPQFCCLGVLCVMAAEAGVVTVSSYRVGSWTEWSFNGDTSALPQGVMEWAGIVGMDALGKEVWEEGGPDDTPSLAGLNDGGTTFVDIADIIEKRVQGVTWA